mmetsp:Transcript_116457/g.267383  ORF Transcript_116457/g.267383 Transcript_116457/m.267383 type:complete len:367 (-) Transcript_116457:387-1487(-)
MFRSIPVGNKICARKTEQRRHELHRDKIRRMKPSVDTTAPLSRTYDHVRVNLKREQLLEERYSEIDRENRILLQKMSDIMRHGNLAQTADPKGPVSLNKDLRKRELVRITQENRSILKRIQHAQPIYNHVEWDNAHKQNQVYAKNVCEYPWTLKKPNSLLPLPSKDMTTDMYQDSQQAIQQILDDDLTAGKGADGPGKELEEELRYVLKEGKKIGSSYYLVEMATDGRTLTVSAYDGDTQQTLELLVNEKNHRKLYRECNGDYGALAGRLAIDNDRLILQPLAAGNATGAERPAPAKSPEGMEDVARGTGATPVPPSGSLTADDMAQRARQTRLEMDVGENDEGPQVDVQFRGFTPTTTGTPSKGY